MDDVGGWDSDIGAIIVAHLPAVTCSVLRRIDRASREKWSPLCPGISAVLDACVSGSVRPQRLARLNLAEARFENLLEFVKDKSQDASLKDLIKASNIAFGTTAAEDVDEDGIDEEADEKLYTLASYEPCADFKGLTNVTAVDAGEE